MNYIISQVSLSHIHSAIRPVSVFLADDQALTFQSPPVQSHLNFGPLSVGACASVVVVIVAVSISLALIRFRRKRSRLRHTSRDVTTRDEHLLESLSIVERNPTYASGRETLEFDWKAEFKDTAVTLIDRDSLLLSDVIGQGAFGKVHKGIFKCSEKK